VLVLTLLSTELQIIPMRVRFSASVIRTSLIRVCAWQKCVTVEMVVFCWETAAMVLLAVTVAMLDVLVTAVLAVMELTVYLAPQASLE
jgi:hypothetical protein